ncbi:MAG: RecX family transcriptional regulator [Dehalococcoidia bacterium]|nr:RecX family transcriptional regulator [Dehalococcoidia bacterium]
MALGYVSFKPRAITEVRRRIGRDFTQPVVECVLDSLTRYGYLDDAEYAMQWRRSREKRKPRGAFLLRRELRATTPWTDWTKRAAPTERANERRNAG